jgi:hypothetical protein
MFQTFPSLRVVRDRQRLFFIAARVMRRLTVTLLSVIICCSFAKLLVAQEPLPAASGSGVAFVDPAPHKGIKIAFDNYDPLHGHGPMESHYVYDPQTVVVLDHTGKPVDLSAVHHARVNFIAQPNRHGITDFLDSRMEISKLVLQPPEARPGDAVQELEEGRQKEAEQVNAIMAQWQAYQEQERKKQAAREAVERTKAEQQEKLRQQIAQKRQEDLQAHEKENERKVAQAQQKQKEVQARRQRLAANIVRTKAKIEQQDVAPAGVTIKYAVSPHGLHIAAATLKGSRAQILMDGVPGPEFDELIWVPRRILHHGELPGDLSDMNVHDAPVVFSDDGTRYAYVGRQGNQFVLIVDGKEANRGQLMPQKSSSDTAAIRYEWGSLF